jgi:hypothetical protein
LNTTQIDDNIDEYINAVSLMDNVLVFIMVGFFILIGLTAFRVSSHPAFFVVSIVLVIFMGFISYFFNVIFIELVTPAIFNATRVAFPKSMIICTNLHWVALIGFTIESIALYGKKPKGQFVE